jgi:hypothetical protein
MQEYGLRWDTGPHNCIRRSPGSHHARLIRQVVNQFHDQVMGKTPRSKSLSVRLPKAAGLCDRISDS